MSSFFPLPLSPRHPLVRLTVRSRSGSPATLHDKSVRSSAVSLEAQVPALVGRMSRSSSSDAFYSARSRQSESPLSRNVSPIRMDVKLFQHRALCPPPRCQPLVSSAAAPSPIQRPANVSTYIDNVNAFLSDIISLSTTKSVRRPHTTPSDTVSSNATAGERPVHGELLLMWLEGREGTARRRIEGTERQCRGALLCHQAVLQHHRRTHRAGSKRIKDDSAAHAVNQRAPYADVSQYTHRDEEWDHCVGWKGGSEKYLKEDNPLSDRSCNGVSVTPTEHSPLLKSHHDVSMQRCSGESRERFLHIYSHFIASDKVDTPKGSGPRACLAKDPFSDPNAWFLSGYSPSPFCNAVSL